MKSLREHLPKQTWQRVVFLLLVLFIAAVRLRLLNFPLERDEGEYAYIGQLLLDGVAPYKLAYNMKLPGIYAVYALIMACFGQSIAGIHLGLLLANLATTWIVFLFTRNLVGDAPGIVAAAIYGLLSLGASALGFAAHATQFLLPFALFGGYLLLEPKHKRCSSSRLFLAGFCYGLAILIKAVAAFFLIFGFFLLLLQAENSGKKAKPSTFGWLFLGALTPVAITLLFLLQTGVFNRFWYWTVRYAFSYSAQVPLDWIPGAFLAGWSRAVHDFWFLWLFAGLGLITLWLDRRLKEQRFVILIFFLCSFLSICPGFYFREHYFITLMPAAGLLAAVFAHFLLRYSRPELILALLLTAASPGLWQQRGYFFTEAPASLSRTIYPGNAFYESLEIAKFIQQRTSKSDTIAILGSEPQIYFYANRRSATGYIYAYGMMEDHPGSLAMQKEMASQIEAAKPPIVIYAFIPASWSRRQSSPTYIFDWARDYLGKHYALSGVVDILPEKTIFRWGAQEAASYRQKSACRLNIFERKAEQPRHAETRASTPIACVNNFTYNKSLLSDA